MIHGGVQTGPMGAQGDELRAGGARVPVVAVQPGETDVKRFVGGVVDPDVAGHLLGQQLQGQQGEHGDDLQAHADGFAGGHPDVGLHRGAAGSEERRSSRRRGGRILGGIPCCGGGRPEIGGATDLPGQLEHVGDETDRLVDQTLDQISGPVRGREGLDRVTLIGERRAHQLGDLGSVAVRTGEQDQVQEADARRRARDPLGNDGRGVVAWSDPQSEEGVADHDVASRVAVDLVDAFQPVRAISRCRPAHAGQRREVPGEQVVDRRSTGLGDLRDLRQNGFSRSCRGRPGEIGKTERMGAHRHIPAPPLDTCNGPRADWSMTQKSDSPQDFRGTVSEFFRW